MMRISNGERADDPLARFRPDWRLRARNAKDMWLPGTLSMESALESTFLDGVKFAAELLEMEGHHGLAVKLRAWFSEGPDQAAAVENSLEGVQTNLTQQIAEVKARAVQ